VNKEQLENPTENRDLQTACGLKRLPVILSTKDWSKQKSLIETPGQGFSSPFPHVTVETCFILLVKTIRDVCQQNQNVLLGLGAIQVFTKEDE
jgi:PhoPQ-activated pathogenicity-related protein